MIIIIAIWVGGCLMILVNIQKNYLVERNTSFKTRSMLGEMCYQAFGKWGVYILETCTTITMLGVGIVFIAAAAELLCELPWDLAKASFLYENKVIFVIIISVVLISLVLLRDSASLSCSSMFGNIAILISLILVISYGLSSNDLHVHDIPYVRTSTASLSNLFGSLIFSYGVVFNILPILEDMKEKKKFPISMNAALGSACILYILVSVSLVFIYNNIPGGIKGQILNNIERTSPCYYISVALVSIMCILSFPLAVSPAIQILQPKATDDNGFFTCSPKRIGARLLILVFEGLLAAAIPNFNTAVTLIGDITLTFGTFVLPPLLHLKLCKDISKAQVVGDIFLTVIGIATMIFTTTNSILDLVN